MKVQSAVMIVKTLEGQLISEERKALLNSVVEYIVNNAQASKVSHLVFVCTHNSRRSQMAQFWAHYLSDHYGLRINAYSGGTEVTALAPQAAKVIEELGINYTVDHKSSSNPTYQFKMDPGNKDIELYSKLFTEITESLTAFASLMCCAQAEESCPFVPGTELRISLNYQDPKRADGTANEAAAYHNCLILIGSEINYILSEVKKQLS